MRIFFFPVPFVFASLFPRSWSGWSCVLRHLPSCSHKSIGGSGCEGRQGQIQAIAPKLRAGTRLAAGGLPHVPAACGTKATGVFYGLSLYSGKMPLHTFFFPAENILADTRRVASLGKKWPRNPFVFERCAGQMDLQTKI